MEKSITKKTYHAGVSVVFASAYSQYLIGGLSPVLAGLLVYGPPLLIKTCAGTKHKNTTDPAIEKWQSG